MGNICLSIFASEGRTMETMVSVYSFLDKNPWFKGDILIFSNVNVFDNEWKDTFRSFYKKIFFIENEFFYSEEDVFVYIKNELCYDSNLKINDRVLFCNNIQNIISFETFIFDINDIKEGIIFSSDIISNEDITNCNMIFFNEENINGAIKEMVDSYINEIMFTGPQYKFKTFEDERLFRKDFEDRFKTVVCTCAKNENDYIIEWIEHYLNMGFDKIFICDNNEDESLLGVIQNFIDLGVVEVFNCRGLSCFQVQFYSMFCTEGNYEWCGYFDCDEFLEIPSYFSVKHYLSDKSNEFCVSFHWMVYGSNGELRQKEGLLKERFKFPVSPISLFTENCYIKSIVRGDGVFYKGCWFNGSHIPLTTPMYEHNVGGHFITDCDRHCYFPPKYKDGYIRHYYTKSFSEWLNKSKRGWPDGTDTLKTERYFICEDWVSLPLERMAMGLFSLYDGIESTKKYYLDLIKGSDVVNIENKTQNVYGLLIGMYNVLQCFTDYTFILGESHIDDTTFNLILEYGIRTGNRVVWAETLEEKMNVVNKYSKISDTYFNLEFE